MKTTIVTGLLGAGKTTFIRNHLKDSTEKTVVLVNDFGKAGIDGEIFSASGIESMELPSGCVCCTLRYDLITTIANSIRRFSPDHLVIEPSGVASPSGVLEALDSAGIVSSSVIGIVDVTEFVELYQSGMYGRFFEDQVVHADVILVNKADLVKEEKIVEAERLIEAINPRAVLFRTIRAVLPQPAPLLPGRKSARTNQDSRLLLRSPDHVHFETLSFFLNAGIGLAFFSSFFDDLAGGVFGRAARAKALINSDQGPYRFDAVYGKVDRTAFEQEVAGSRLVIIGDGLKREAIEKALLIRK